MSDGPILEAALAWAALRVGCVPVHDVGPGELVPAFPGYLEKPMLGEPEIREFYSLHPDAQLAIILDNSAWGGPRLGCVDDDSGKHDTHGRGRPRPLGGYRESTRSGGTHDLFRYGTSLPPDVPSRTTGIWGFVDVLVGGIVYVAPTVNRGRGEYRVVTPLNVGMPSFSCVGEALDAASNGLREAWLEKTREGGGAGVAAHGDFSECYRVAVRAVAAGADERGVQAAVGCDHTEWDDRHIHRSVRKIRRWLAAHPLPEPVPVADGGDQDFFESTLNELARSLGIDPAPYLSADGRHYARPGAKAELRDRVDTAMLPPGHDPTPAEDVPTDLVVAYEDVLHPDWDHGVHTTFRSTATGRPTHVYQPHRVAGWADAVSNEERALRLLRQRKLYLAARGGTEVWAFVATGLPARGRAKIGPRGVARRVADRVKTAATDRWVVCLPEPDGTMSVHAFAFGIPVTGAAAFLEAANAELQEIFGADAVRDHPMRRDKQGDDGRMVLPEAGDVEPDIDWRGRARSHVFPYRDTVWTRSAPLLAVRRFFVRRLTAPIGHVARQAHRGTGETVGAARVLAEPGVTDGARRGFHMGVRIVGDWSSPVGSFFESTYLSADDVIDSEVDIDQVRASTGPPVATADEILGPMRERHRDQHKQFFESERAPEEYHLQACDDCDAYCLAHGIVRPVRAELSPAEEWGSARARPLDHNTVWDPPSNW